MDTNLIKGIQLGGAQGLTTGGILAMVVGDLVGNLFIIGLGAVSLVAGIIFLLIWRHWYGKA